MLPHGSGFLTAQTSSPPRIPHGPGFLTALISSTPRLPQGPDFLIAQVQASSRPRLPHVAGCLTAQASSGTRLSPGPLKVQTFSRPTPSYGSGLLMAQVLSRYSLPQTYHNWWRNVYIVATTSKRRSRPKYVLSNTILTICSYNNKIKHYDFSSLILTVSTKMTI